jgi:hypothetical protein
MSVPFCGYSKTASQFEGTQAWEASHDENIACKSFIDSRNTGITTVYSGFSVDKDHSYTKNLIDRFGWQRTMCVLAATIHQKKKDVRFTEDNRDWAVRRIANMNKAQVREYALESHPGLVNALTDNIRAEFKALGLYGAACCEPDSFLENKILAVRPESLCEDYYRPEYQMFYTQNNANGNPLAGHTVNGIFLANGAEATLNRMDFIGAVRESLIPMWAREKVQELEQQELGALSEENIEEMEMMLA